MGVAVALAAAPGFAQNQGGQAPSPGQGQTQGLNRQTQQPTPQDMDRLIAEASYALGMNIANNMKQQGLELDVERITAGMKAAYGQAEPEMNPQQAQAALAALQRVMQQQAQAQAQQMSARGDEVLARNAAREAVTVTNSGLQYEVIEQGDGTSPSAQDTVTVHYEGRTVDGNVFDSSYERGQPATFQLDQVIPGWSEGVALMEEGAKYKFWIPSDLAYGQRGAPRAGIGPNQMLIFEVELMEVSEGESADANGQDAEG